MSVKRWKYKQTVAYSKCGKLLTIQKKKGHIMEHGWISNCIEWKEPNQISMYSTVSFIGSSRTAKLN